MKFRTTFLLAMFVIAIWCVTPQKAVAAGVPVLVVSQFKVTSSGGQFVTLYNTTDATLDLALFELDYINGAGKLTNVPMSGQLTAHGYYILSDDQQRICYQAIVNASSLGFATTSGSLQIWQTSADKTVKQLQDNVTWASKTTVGAVTLPTQNAASTVSLLRQPTDSLGNPQVSVPGTGMWQAVVPDAANPCTLNLVNTTVPTVSPSSNPGNQLTVGQVPPATIVNLPAGTGEPSNAPILPPEDIGLSAPRITELLPNPSGTGTDATDEYIELYNPNTVPFHLVGFTLQTGSTTKHNHQFVDGVVLPPQSFTAFYSAETGLGLSNSSGQAALLDPFGNMLDETDPYVTAKDGQTWALADGDWYWTSRATPNAANVIEQAASDSKSTSTGKVKGVTSTTSTTTAGAKSAAADARAATVSQAGATAEPASKQITTHRYVLVVIGALAVGYGIYEYRHDLGNRLHQFRQNRAARRNNRPALARR